MTWAPAILVDADKVSFYKCGFSSLQDTVTDDRGRHLYKNCFIQGAVDFIWVVASLFSRLTETKIKNISHFSLYKLTNNIIVRIPYNCVLITFIFFP